MERAQVVTESQFVEALRGVDQHVAFGREPGKDIHLMKKRHVLDYQGIGLYYGFATADRSNVDATKRAHPCVPNQN